MYKKIVLYLMLLCVTSFAFAQEKDTTNVKKQENVPVISYSGTAKKYKIANIKVSGVKNYDDFVLIGFSGLAVGEEITVPGDEVTSAVKRFWKHVGSLLGSSNGAKICANRYGIYFEKYTFL